MSPELFLSIVAATFSVLAFLVALSAYTSIRSLTKARGDAARAAAKSEAHDLSVVLYMDDTSQELKDSTKAPLALSRFSMQLIVAMMTSLWREGLITSNHIIQRLPSAWHHLETLFPESFPVRAPGASIPQPADDTSEPTNEAEDAPKP